MSYSLEYFQKTHVEFESLLFFWKSKRQNVEWMDWDE